MKFWLSIFLVLSYAASHAQDPLIEFNRLTISNWNSGYLQVGPYRVKGTPFLFGKSLPGEITFHGGGKQTGKNIFYDIYQQKAGPDVNNNLFEANQPVEKFTVQLPAEYGGQMLEFRATDGYGKSPMKGFAAVLAEGETGTLLKYYKAILMADPVNQMDKQARAFNQVAEYYFFNKSTGEAKKIKLREKDILKELKGVDGVSSFIQSHNFDLSTETGMSLFIATFK